MAVEAGIALAAKEASQGDVADAAPLSHPRRTGQRKLVWGEGRMRLRSFAAGGTRLYPSRGIMITNGWDDAPKQQGHAHVAALCDAFNRLASLTTPAA